MWRGQRLPHEVGEDFGVGLRVENMSTFNQLVAQDLIILDDPVVDEVKPTRFVGMGVGIFAGDCAVRGPAGVADADRSRNGIFSISSARFAMRPMDLRRWIWPLSRMATPAESYPRYSKRRRPSINTGRAAERPM